jgi:hypothetical protein
MLENLSSNRNLAGVLDLGFAAAATAYLIMMRNWGLDTLYPGKLARVHLTSPVDHFTPCQDS